MAAAFGGELACQLVSKPTLLMCDEVMSGLDSSAAVLVIQHLWAVADGGSVNCTVHTPTTALFSMSVTLCLLSQGRVAYFGLSTDVEA